MTRLLRLPTSLLVLVAASIALPAQESIVNSPHNLSASGPGQVRALAEDRVCVFCHTPHGARAEAPLWNRKDSAAFYTPYDSPTITAKPGQPTGSSKLCLSCHDGTVALGDLVSESVAMSGGATMSSGGGLIGTDLRDDHPISFSYAASMARPQGELAPPHAWSTAIRLDDFGMMQCTTCHDPHDNQWEKFLVMDNMAAALCRECHRIEDFDHTAHATATSTWNGIGRDPWPHTKYTDVASNACMNCHQAHHAPGSEVLRTASRDEDVCLACHDGSVARDDIGADFRQPYRHPIFETSGGHRPGEQLSGTPDHVTCVDCHNPHKAIAATAEAPFVSGLLRGVSGMTESGTFIDEAVYEYEVCFKCHAEPTATSFLSANRQIPSNNIRSQFGTGSPSFHPVVSPGLSPHVPSLLSPLTEASMIYCTDCHGGSGATTTSLDTSRAPHGSAYPHLLSREYRTGANIIESPSAYALCYSCHDRSSILANESFPHHRQHIVDTQTSCSVCHDAHGIDSVEGNSINHAFLMNFDLSFVEPLPRDGSLEFTSMGAGSGSCSLRCHGVDHDDVHY